MTGLSLLACRAQGSRPLPLPEPFGTQKTMHSAPLLVMLHASRFSSFHAYLCSSLVPLAMLVTFSVQSTWNLPQGGEQASFLKVRLGNPEWPRRMNNEEHSPMGNTAWWVLLPLRHPQGSDRCTLLKDWATGFSFSLCFPSDIQLLSSSIGNEFSSWPLSAQTQHTSHGSSLCSSQVVRIFLTSFFPQIAVTFQIFHSRRVHKAC